MINPKCKMFLWGWFGFNNLGDDLLLYTILDYLEDDETVITVSMHNIYDINKKNIREIKRSYKNLLWEIRRNNILIIGPGGLFPFDDKKKVFIYYLIVLFWKLFRRKVIFWGIGVSDNMSFTSRFLWKRIVKNSDLFLTRSKNLLKNLKIQETENVHSMADAVFGSRINIKSSASESKRRIAISVANLKNEKQGEVYNKVVDVWCEVVNYLVEANYMIDVISFTKGNDDYLVKDIVAKTNNKNVRAIYYKFATTTVQDWDQYSMTICMRFHSLVLSILNGVPAIPIAYGHKSYNLAKECNLDKYTVMWNPFQPNYYGKTIDTTADKIIEKITAILNDMDNVKVELKFYRKYLIGSAQAAFIQLKNTIY